MSTIEGAAKLARTLGRQMEANPCAGVYAITADMDFETHYGKRANKRRKMYNGMIPSSCICTTTPPSLSTPQSPCPSPDLTASAVLTRRTEPEKCARPEK